MTIEVACSCGRVLKAPDSAVGKKGRCKGCGQIIEISSPVADEPIPDLAVEINEENAVLDPRIAPLASPANNRTMPTEPWFYGFLVFYAMSCVVIAIAQFCLVLIGVLIQVQQAISEGRSFSIALGTIVLISLAWMLGIILVSCPILLAVDAARNLRAMRYEVKL